MKTMVLVILALLTLVIAEQASSKPLKPKDTVKIPIGQEAKIKGLVVDKKMTADGLVLFICESRKRKECFSFIWHKGIVPDMGEVVTVTGRRIR